MATAQFETLDRTNDAASASPVTERLAKDVLDVNDTLGAFSGCASENTNKQRDVAASRELHKLAQSPC